MANKKRGTIDEQAGPSSPAGEKPKWGYIKPGFFQWVREEWGENNKLIFYHDMNNTMAPTTTNLDRDFEITEVNIQSGQGAEMKSRIIRIAIISLK
jgi:hypothetical protein